MTEQTLYRAEADDAMIVQSLGDLTLLFHRPSGQTHMVVSPVPEILNALREGEGDLSLLYERLSKDFDLGEASVAQRNIEQHLHELVNLGVVQRT